jgi:A/G-specific adenine glycosylase
LTGIAIEVGPEIHSVKFAVTKHQVTMHVFPARSIGGGLSPGGGLVDAAWVSLEDLRKLTFGAAGRRLLTWLEKSKTSEWLSQ